MFPTGETAEESPDVEETETLMTASVSDSPFPGIERPGILRTNFLRVSKRFKRVEGQYMLDLSLPSFSTPGVVSDTDGKNLSLHTTCGPVNAEVWIVHDGSGKSRQVSLAMSTDSGRIRAKVNEPSCPDGSADRRPSLDIDLRADHGDVFVSLPHCFQGSITIRTGDERVALSPSFKKSAAPLLDVPGILQYFVGDLERGRGPGSSSGNKDGNDDPEFPFDKLLISGKFTSVRINWEGEKDLPEIGLNPLLSVLSVADRFFTTGILIDTIS
ncbi:hypothetical protein F5148DRAFT_344641 [Russula earlei]|uniref:Uncharacterized protein n=1 Tax=Russula earlei TaxID=71964 RepID=A0ACC0UJ86_9AGAM|nr:hypothetical protein F5148DRAFT_344641 [Russula earlei]